MNFSPALLLTPGLRPPAASLFDGSCQLCTHESLATTLDPHVILQIENKWGFFSLLNTIIIEWCCCSLCSIFMSSFNQSMVCGFTAGYHSPIQGEAVTVQ
jgi:hypothetical protein